MTSRPEPRDKTTMGKREVDKHQLEDAVQLHDSVVFRELQLAPKFRARNSSNHANPNQQQRAEVTQKQRAPGNPDRSGRSPAATAAANTMSSGEVMDYFFQDAASYGTKPKDNRQQQQQQQSEASGRIAHGAAKGNRKHGAPRSTMKVGGKIGGYSQENGREGIATSTLRERAGSQIKQPTDATQPRQRAQPQQQRQRAAEPQQQRQRAAEPQQRQRAAEPTQPRQRAAEPAQPRQRAESNLRSRVDQGHRARLEPQTQHRGNPKPKNMKTKGRTKTKRRSLKKVVGRPTSGVIRELSMLLGKPIPASVKQQPPKLPPRKASPRTSSIRSRRRSTSALKYLSSTKQSMEQVSDNPIFGFTADPLFQLDDEIAVERRVSLGLPSTADQFEEELDPVEWERESERRKDEELAGVRMQQLNQLLQLQQEQRKLEDVVEDVLVVEEHLADGLDDLSRRQEVFELQNTSQLVQSGSMELAKAAARGGSSAGTFSLNNSVQISLLEALTCMGLLPERANICESILRSEGVDLVELKYLTEQDFIDLGIALGDRRKILRNRDALVV